MHTYSICIVSIYTFIHIYIYSDVCDGRNHLFPPLLAQFLQNYLGMLLVKSYRC